MYRGLGEMDVSPWILRVDFGTKVRWTVRGQHHKGVAGPSLAATVWKSVVRDIERARSLLSRIDQGAEKE